MGIYLSVVLLTTYAKMADRHDKSQDFFEDPEFVESIDSANVVNLHDGVSGKIPINWFDLTIDGVSFQIRKDKTVEKKDGKEIEADTLTKSIGDKVIVVTSIKENGALKKEFETTKLSKKEIEAFKKEWDVKFPRNERHIGKLKKFFIKVVKSAHGDQKNGKFEGEIKSEAYRAEGLPSSETLDEERRAKTEDSKKQPYRSTFFK